MNKILVEVSVGELLDKISILEIKQEKIKDPEKLKFINDEHSILKDQLDSNVKSDEKLNTLFQSLKDINAKLWVIEDDKRQYEKEKDFTEKFINDEYEVLKSELEKNVKLDEKLEKFFVALKNVNSKLWIIEDDKRKCEKDSNFGENFIRLSRDVHFLNDTRAKIKLDINNHSGSKIKEIKEYTNY